MKIKLTPAEKREMLKAISDGMLNTARLARVTSEIKGADIFDLNGYRTIGVDLFKVMTKEEIQDFDKWFDENY